MWAFGDDEYGFSLCRLPLVIDGKTGLGQAFFELFAGEDLDQGYQAEEIPDW